MTFSPVLSTLPAAGEKRLAIRVSPGALRHVRQGHPWVFDDSISSVSDDGATGDLGVIFDKNRRFAAIGLWDPTSPISLRILHAGKPVTIDDEWWADRFATAMNIRNELENSDRTTAYRCINGESDGFGGLVLDRYGDTWVFKVYSAVWLPYLDLLTRLVVEHYEPDAVVLRLSRNLANGLGDLGLTDGMALFGAQPTKPVVFLENGLLFEADVVAGQKTGHFLDQRDNRQRVRRMTGGARVLDAFSCTGGFSVYAASGGAAAVDSIDMNRSALSTAQANMAHNRNANNVGTTEHRVLDGDAFALMEMLGRKNELYDMVIVDPPSFAQRQRDVEGAIVAYRRLTELAVALVRDGGRLVQSSCSSRVVGDRFYDAVEGTAAEAGVDLLEVKTYGHAVDHPATFDEGVYLKALFAKVKK